LGTRSEALKVITRANLTAIKRLENWFLGEIVYKMVLLVYVSKQYRHGLVVDFGEFGSNVVGASAKEAKISSCGQAFSG
jgi:hypothetical protein